MLAHKFGKLMVFAAVALLATACSDDEKKGAALGEACSIDADCQEGLVCRGQVCIGTEPDTDAGNNGGEDGSTDDGGTPVTEENFRVSFKLADTIQGVESMRILNTATGEEQTVSPEGWDCRGGCWLNGDASQFLYLRANTQTPGTFDLYQAPTTTLPVEFCEPETDCLVAVAVRGIEVEGNFVTYSRAEGNNNVAYFKELGSGDPEVAIGSIGTTESTQGDWFIAPEAQKAVVYQPTLQTLDLLIGELGELQETVDFTVNSQNYQEVSGSYFGGTVATAINSAGTRMAFVTQRAPLDGRACDNSSDCLNPGARCGRFDRCAFIQVAVHIVDLENVDNLDGPCSSNEACGGVHTCDIPSETQLDQARCIPRRIVLGLPPEQQQGDPPQSGCALTTGLDDFFFTDVRGPLSFGADGQLYLTASRACDEGNAPYSAILAITPETGEIRDVRANRMNNFFAEECYDFDEMVATPETCNPYVARALMGPQGNKLAVIATNPTVGTPMLAPRLTDLWTINRDGTEFTWVGKHEQLEAVTTLNVHPLP